MKAKEEKILKTIEEFSKKLPKFQDGRINYSNSDVAPVITVFIRHKNRILLLKRSEKVLTYKGKWNMVAGYLDELKPIREKIEEEIREELGITENIIHLIKMGEAYEFRDNKIGKTWIIFPVLAEFKNEPEVKLDWEHTEYKWIKPEELENFDIVPNLNESLKRVI